MHAWRVLARQRQHPVRLPWAAILRQKKENPGRLVVGEVTQAALRQLHRFWLAVIAWANDLGTRKRSAKQNQHRDRSHRLIILTAAQSFLVGQAILSPASFGLVSLVG